MATTCHTAEATLYVLRPVSEDPIISRRADVVCYAEKPETTDALKDNIRAAIGEIQLHTIDNVLKNWTDRVGYCLASRASHFNRVNKEIFRKILQPIKHCVTFKVAMNRSQKNTAYRKV